MKHYLQRIRVLPLIVVALLCVSARASAQQKTHKVTYNLENMTLEEGPSEVAHGDSIRFTLAPIVSNPPASASSINANVDGVDAVTALNRLSLDSESYSIRNVTGDVVIESSFSYGTEKAGDTKIYYLLNDAARTATLEATQSTLSEIVVPAEYAHTNGISYRVTEVKLRPTSSMTVVFNGYAPAKIATYGGNLENLSISVPKGSGKVYKDFLMNKGIPEANITERTDASENAPTGTYNVTYKLVNATLVAGPTQFQYGDTLAATIIPDFEGAAEGPITDVIFEKQAFGFIWPRKWSETETGNILKIPNAFTNVTVMVTYNPKYTDSEQNVYRIENGEAILCEVKGTQSSLTLPETIEVNGQSYPVVGMQRINNSNITSLTVPASFRKFKVGFTGLNLQTLRLLSPEVPGVFTYTEDYGIDFENCQLIVPEGSLETYKNNSFWGQFKNISEYVPEPVTVSMSNRFLESSYLPVGKECQSTPIYMDFSSLEQDYRIALEMENSDKLAIQYGSEYDPATGKLVDGKALAFTAGKAEIRKSECRIDTEGGKMRVIPYLAITAKEAGEFPYKIKVYDESGKTCYCDSAYTFKAIKPVGVTVDPTTLTGNIREGLPFNLKIDRSTLGDLTGKAMTLGLYLTGGHIDNTLSFTDAEGQSYPFEQRDFYNMNASYPLTMDKDSLAFTLKGDSAIKTEYAYISFSLTYDGRTLPTEKDVAMFLEYDAKDLVIINTTDSVVTDIEVGSITIKPNKDTEEATTANLENVKTETLQVEAEANTSLTLSGTNDLGVVKNEGTLTLTTADEDLKLNVTSVENNGVLIDETGQIMEVTGDAGLAVQSPGDQTVEEGASVTLTATASGKGVTEENVNFQWQKLNTENNTWENVANEPIATKAASLLRAVSDVVTDHLTINAEDAGKYRCLITREETKEEKKIITTLTVYSEVTKASTPAPEPSVSYYDLTIPSIEGASTNPAAGTYSVEEGDSFGFTITLDEGYGQSTPIVKVGDQVIEPDANGQYTISNVQGNVTISISGIEKDTPTSNAEVEGDTLQVWAANGQLHISSPKATKAYVVTFGGRLYKALSLPAGEYSEQMPQGSYIIHVGKRSYKLRF